jgi:hypothetical protein
VIEAIEHPQQNLDVLLNIELRLGKRLDDTLDAVQSRSLASVYQPPRF